MGMQIEKEGKRRLIGARLQKLREEKTQGEKRKCMSQYELASELGVSRPTLQRYETENPMLGESTLGCIARYFKAPIDYLTGETDISDTTLYYINLEKEQDAGMDAYEEEHRAQIAKTESLFNMCGYQYENIENTREFLADELSGAVGKPFRFSGPHKLTDPAGVNETVYLSDPELQALQARLGDTVAFECFRIKRGRDKENGNG